MDTQKQEIINNISDLYDFLENSDRPKRTKMLFKWTKAYCWFLKHEHQFKPIKNCKYPRGSVVKVNFGYRINHEFGGVHYAIVINMKNAQSDDLVTVIPLTSLKKTADPKHLRTGQIYLGDEIYNALFDKLTAKVKTLQTIIAYLNSLSEILESSPDSVQAFLHEMPEEIHQALSDQGVKKFDGSSEFLNDCLNTTKNELKFFKKGLKEISFMKKGSIALVNQIITISKMRIRDPVNSRSVFYGIKLSDQLLDLINSEIKNSFIY